MTRREFISLLGGAAAWPFAASAQQSAMPVIGFLGANTPASQSQWTAAFVERLRELGWSEGRNISIQYRWAKGRADRSAEITAEFARLNVDVIATLAVYAGLFHDREHTVVRGLVSPSADIFSTRA